MRNRANGMTTIQDTRREQLVRQNAYKRNANATIALRAKRRTKQAEALACATTTRQRYMTRRVIKCTPRVSSKRRRMMMMKKKYNAGDGQKVDRGLCRLRHTTQQYCQLWQNGAKLYLSSAQTSTTCTYCAPELSTHETYTMTQETDRKWKNVEKRPKRDPLPAPKPKIRDLSP